MTEDDARAWITDKFGDRAAGRIEQFLQYVVAETIHQNLIAPSTVDSIWVRHALDSAQLVLLSPSGAQPWIDIGTGGGFPGMIVALLRPEPIILVEPRRRRAAFLAECVGRLDLADRVTVVPSKIEAVATSAGTISARAVSSVADLLDTAVQCSTFETVWVLPRGQIAPEEVASLRKAWQFVFHVEQSITNPESSILILREVSRR